MDLNFDFPLMSPVQITVAFMCIGFATGMVIYWVSVTGTAVRWALNS